MSKFEEPQYTQPSDYQLKIRNFEQETELRSFGTPPRFSRVDMNICE